MKIKLSATFRGRCMLCEKLTTVFTLGDEDSKKTVTLCKECSDKLENMLISKVIEKYGKVDNEAFKNK